MTRLPAFLCFDAAALWGLRWLWACVVALVPCLVWSADTAPEGVVLERTPDGLYLSARLPVHIPADIEEVLLRGVPLHFVWRADVRRSRWYWTDATLASRSRWVRLAYQPLTRRWRVTVTDDGATAEAGSPNALHQNLDTMAEALAAVRRVSRWRIAGPAELGKVANARVEFEYRLEAGLLPRPFQIGLRDAEDWGVAFRQVLPLPPTDAPPRTDWLEPDGTVDP
jgi:hypothetical protein